MLKNRNIQKSLSLLLVAVYAFVVLFSAKFHQHSHGFFGTEFLSKSEKKYTPNYESVSANDCVACHFLTHKITFLPITFKLEPVVLSEVQREKFSYILKDFTSEFFFVQLRGPPVSI